jgi:hypothetical protein
MRKAKAGGRDYDPSRQFREMEGEKKKRESRVSALDVGNKEMPGANWDDTHYSELERQIGTDQMQFIKEMDEHVLKGKYITEPYEGKGSKSYENWLKMRQQYIDMFNRPEGIMYQGPKSEGAIVQGPSKWETG